MSATAKIDRRPTLAFRVGVTGTRALDTTAEPHVRAAVRTLLNSVRSEIEKLAHEPEAGRAYRQTADGDLRPRLRLVSPLAEGADRLVAEEALHAGYELEVVMPFAQVAYEQDFPETVDTFRRLLAQAGSPPRVLTLDGARDDDRDRSYEAVGRMVVRNCDLLIAIWDGQHAKGKGGTAEIVRFAAQNGGPVWWIHTDGLQPPVLIQEAYEFRWRELNPPPSGGKAHEALDAYLRQTIVPPLPAGDSVRDWVVAGLSRVGVDVRGAASLESHLVAQDPPRHWLWRSYASLMNLIAGRMKGVKPTQTPSNPVVEWWNGYYEPADRLSASYGDRYRSSYVLVFAVGACALIAAVAGLAFEEIERWTVLLELLLLLAAGCLFTANLVNNWHGRWLGYRLLAELCRKQRMLALLGWSLPVWETASLADEPPWLKERSSEDSPPEGTAFREDWVGWYFSALVRGAPLPTGNFRDKLLDQTLQLGEALLHEQIGYHTARSRQSHAASHSFGLWGRNFFILTVLLVVLKLLLYATPLQWRHEITLWSSLACAVLPTITAFFIGIRSYAEFELLASQSDQMLDLLQAAFIRLAAARKVLDADPRRTLMSQEVGAEIYDIAFSMLQDVKGWAQLFRQKRVEMG